MAVEVQQDLAFHLKPVWKVGELLWTTTNIIHVVNLFFLLILIMVDALSLRMRWGSECTIWDHLVTKLPQLVPS